MARGAAENGMPLPRSLATIRAVRRECVPLYPSSQKAAASRPRMAGRLAMILQLLANLSRDHGFEERLDRLEAATAERDGAPPLRPNGKQRPPRRSPAVSPPQALLARLARAEHWAARRCAPPVEHLPDSRGPQALGRADPAAAEPAQAAAARSRGHVRRRGGRSVSRADPQVTPAVHP
jgi:hypothetical protein